MSSVCAKKISRKKPDFSVLSVVFLCIQKAATHGIKRWNITEGMFWISSLYLAQFSCNYFFTEIMKEGAVDPFNGWHFNAAGYLNSWQQMC